MSRAEPPFLPFLAGPPQFQPGLKQIDPDNWLLPDTEKPQALAQKLILLRTDRETVFQQIPGSEAGQAEVRSMVEQAINKTSATSDQPDLLAASLLVSDDLCLMEKREKEWVLTAGSLMAPTHWSLQNAIGKSLAGLHGPVPNGAPDLSAKVTTMFDRVPPGPVFERFNWTVQFGNERFLPNAAIMRKAAANADPQTGYHELYLRVERQTILRLPKTGGILFCIRICLDPLPKFNQEHLQKLLQSWQLASDEVRKYKKWAVFEPLMQALAKSRSVPY